MQLRIILFLFYFLIPILTFATQDAISENAEPLAIGNFSVPFSQQIGPLFSFGQNMIGKGVKQVYLFADDYVGVNKHYVDVTPSYLYGISDDLSVFLNAPIAASYKDGDAHSSGMEDIYLQMEYAFYENSNARYYTQATMVGAVSAPTGLTTVDPETGYGAPTFFLGATWNRTYVDWYYFTSYGATLTTSHNSTKFGNQYYYQGGIGRNITYTKKWMYAWLLEADGQYSEKDRKHGAINPNSGGNIVYLIPSILASSKRLILQFGVGYPVTQHLFGNQKRENYLVVANVGWTF